MNPFNTLLVGAWNSRKIKIDWSVLKLKNLQIHVISLRFEKATERKPGNIFVVCNGAKNS